jgi:CheY-like chemotaxis protein
LAKGRGSETLPANTMGDSVVLLSSDLMIASAAEGIARRHGISVRTVGNVGDMVSAVDQAASLIVLDLRTSGLDVGEIVPQLRAHAAEAKIVAFGPHVHEESLASAAAAGCDEVFTRGQFERRLELLLSELKAPADWAAGRQRSE